MAGLFDPITVNGLSFKNRIVMPPMATEKAGEEGRVTPDIIEHYRRRAQRDVGTIIVEHCYVRRDGRVSDRQLGCHRDDLVADLARLAAALRPSGARVLVQLTHGGAAGKGDDQGVVWGAGTSALPGGKTPARPVSALDENGMRHIVDCFARAARRCERAGFDGVELHGAHGYLLNQFLSPLTNNRSDGYGGSPAGRARLPLEVVAAVRAAVDPSFLIYYRLGMYDDAPGGLSTTETAPFAAQLVESGVHVVDLSGGLGGSRPAGVQGEAYFLPHARDIRKQLREAPLVLTGGIRDPRTADRVVRDEGLEFVGIGRALLGDESWAVEARRLLSSTRAEKEGK